MVDRGRPPLGVTGGPTCRFQKEPHLARFENANLLVTLQLPLAPTRLFPVGVEFPLNVAA
jgi:hypothetical protein